MKQRIEPTKKETGPIGVTVVASLMILFGLAEMVTGFTHNFFGITTSRVTIFTYSAAAIGAFYFVSGLLILTMKKWAVVIALVLLGTDVVGRVALAVTGLYPTDSFRQAFAIIAGTTIVVIFAVYIGLKWNSYR
jgi:hypothetical protein